MARRKHEVRRGDGFVTERQTSEGEIRYQARWQEGTKWRSKTFGTIEDAEDHLRTVGRLKRSGRYSPASQMTVKEAVIEYLERGKRRWSSNTYASYEQVAETRLYPHLGKRKVVELTPHDVQRWIDNLASRYSSSSVRNSRIILHGTMKEIIALGVINSNPVLGTMTPTLRRSGRMVWSESHINAVMKVVRGDTTLNAFYTLALSTGLRPGEMRALMWADVDLSAGTISCQRTITRDENFRQHVGVTTKTSRTRTIAIPEIAIKALRLLKVDQNERRLRSEEWVSTDLVFDRGNGLLLPQSSIARWHKNVCDLADVPHCRLHDLRHTAATAMLRSGINIKVVSSILGHTSLATTADVYSHVDVDMQRPAANAMEEILMRESGGA